MTFTRAPLWILLASAACGSSAKSTPPATPAEPAPVVAEATPTPTPTPAPEPTPPPQPQEAPAPPPQPPEPKKLDPACPAIQVKAPDSVSQGTAAKVGAILVGGKGKISYKWSVSAGKIASGQGTANVSVDTKGLSGQTVIATVELGRLSKQCETTTGTVSMLVGP